MADTQGYAVFLFPQVQESPGETLKPYQSQAPAGENIACSNVDSCGAFIQMTLQGTDASGQQS